MVGVGLSPANDNCRRACNDIDLFTHFAYHCPMLSVTERADVSSHWHVAHDLVVHLESPFIHVYAHRGASIELPENTLASFRRALELDPFGIELDLHLSADGVSMVIHDDSVDRTTNGSGAVSSLSCAEMQTLDAGGGERIPTLDEVLALVAGRAHLLLEIKDAAVVPAMLEQVRARPELRWSAMSFNWVVLRAVKDAEPDADLWLSNLGDIELLRILLPGRRWTRRSRQRAHSRLQRWQPIIWLWTREPWHIFMRQDSPAGRGR